MKRFLILFMVLGFVAGSVGTVEAKKTKKPMRAERTVRGSYTNQFVPFSGLAGFHCAEQFAQGCIAVETRGEESYFTASVSDAHGQPVLVTVTGAGPYPGWTVYDTFCGETAEPISFDPGAELRFHIGYWDPYLPTPWADCPPGLGTAGTINVTLSNLP